MQLAFQACLLAQAHRPARAVLAIGLVGLEAGLTCQPTQPSPTAGGSSDRRGALGGVTSMIRPVARSMARMRPGATHRPVA
jgi:hypothetical protein